MESTIVTGGTGTGMNRSNLPTLRAFRPRAHSAIQGGFGGFGPTDLGHTESAPLPIFDPTQDLASVRIT